MLNTEEAIKIVYVLISSDSDTYYEQALLSVYSLRLHNPDDYVVLLVDDVTSASLTGKRAKIKEYVTEVKVVDVPEKYSPKERSRFIKTTFRKYFTGDLLFIDTDTIITGRLSDIGNIDAEIACVLDYHAPLDCLINGNETRERIKNIFSEDVSDENVYFNSGVVFVRDTPAVAQLFEEWHRYWKYSAFEKAQCYDQPALMMADRKCGYMIKELNGIYNCQVLTSIQYLHHARIIHFFNNVWDGKETFSPFFQKQMYEEIKVTGNISDYTKRLVADCKSAFFSPIYFVRSEKVEFLNTLVSATVYSLYKKNSFFYKVLKLLCAMRFSCAKALNRIAK